MRPTQILRAFFIIAEVQSILTLFLQLLFYAVFYFYFSRTYITNSSSSLLGAALLNWLLPIGGIYLLYKIQRQIARGGQCQELINFRIKYQDEAKERSGSSRLPLEGKYAIVTGANTGIGYHTTLQLALLGCHVIIGCRSKDKALEAIMKMNGAMEVEKLKRRTAKAKEEAARVSFGSVKFLQLDLGNLKSVSEFAKAIQSIWDSSKGSAQKNASSSSSIHHPAETGEKEGKREEEKLHRKVVHQVPTGEQQNYQHPVLGSNDERKSFLEEEDELYQQAEEQEYLATRDFYLPKIDYLVNNAGLFSPELGARTKDDAAFDIHIGTNFFGPVLLTELLLPMMECNPSAKSAFNILKCNDTFHSAKVRKGFVGSYATRFDPPRVINLSSIAHTWAAVQTDIAAHLKHISSSTGSNHKGPQETTMEKEMQKPEEKRAEDNNKTNIIRSGDDAANDADGKTKKNVSSLLLNEYGVSKLCNILHTRYLALKMNRRLRPWSSSSSVGTTSSLGGENGNNAAVTKSSKTKSKNALNEDSFVYVACLHPGAVLSDIFRNLDTEFLMHFALPILWKFPEEGAQTTLHCLLSQEILLDHPELVLSTPSRDETKKLEGNIKKGRNTLEEGEAKNQVMELVSGGSFYCDCKNADALTATPVTVSVDEIETVMSYALESVGLSSTL